MAVKVQVTFDCADPGALCQFWCNALGYQLDAPPQGFDSWPEALAAWGVPEADWNSRSACSDPDGVGPRLFFQRVPEAKRVKNRLHLDLRAAEGLRGEERAERLRQRAAELAAVGAVRGEECSDQMGDFWIVMQDPEGNEFCLD